MDSRVVRWVRELTVGCLRELEKEGNCQRKAELCEKYCEGVYWATSVPAYVNDI